MKIMILLPTKYKIAFRTGQLFKVITPLKTIILLNYNFGDMIHTWRGPVYHKCVDVCQYDLSCKKYLKSSGLIPSEMVGTNVLIPLIN